MANTPEILSKLNIGSGMNNTEIIQTLVDAEKIPALAVIEKKQTQAENKISAYGVLKNDVKEFRDVIRSIQKSNASSHIGSSSDATIATFTTSGSTGSENINSTLVVSSIASTHTLASGSYDNNGSTVGAGSLTIDFGTWSTTSSTNDTFTANSNSSITVDTTASTTLIQLRDLINNATDNAEATILYNGTGYVLVLKGKSGASNEIRVTPGGGSSSDLSDNFEYTTSTKQLTQTIDGTDASFSVDGISMTRSTNTISDLFKGYTLELEKTSDQVVNLSSSQNISTVEGLLIDFVNAYNIVYGNITNLTNNAYGSDDLTGPLAGDSLARSIQRELRSFTSESISGYEDGPYSLSLLGVQTQRDGSITLNPNTLKNTFEANPKVVDAMFKDQLTTDNAEVSVTTLGQDTEPGSYAISKSGDNYYIDGVVLSASGTSYTSSSGNSTGMVVKIANSDVTTANIYYGECLMSSIDTTLSSILSYNGDISNRISNLNDSLKDFKDEKTQLDVRMERISDRYKRQFASMEMTIAGLKETGSYLDQMLKQERD